MNKWIVAALTALIVTFSASNAFALISVSLDVPVKFDFKDTTGIKETPVSGMLLKVSLPIFLGLGYDSYTVKPKATDGSEIGNYKVSMYNIYFDLPVPKINISAGVGIGKGDLTPPAGTKSYDPAVLTQYFLSVGYPFLAVLDVHLGMYSMKGKMKPKSSLMTEADMTATMYTLGARVGF